MLSRRIALGAFLFSLVIPGFVSAENIQADMQCPPTGVVGQTCKDMTNGYVTGGHCTHVGVCKADSWNTAPPKGCGSSGNMNAPTADCPKAPPVSGGITTPVATTGVITVGSNTAVNSNIFNNAFSNLPDSPITRANTVSTTTLDGIEYFISGGEALAAGAKLTEEASVSAPPRSTLAIGSVYDLRPPQQFKAAPVTSAYGQEDYHAPDYRVPVAGFTSGGSSRRAETEQVNFANQFAQLWGDSFSGMTRGTIDFLYYASALTPDTTGTVVVTGPYQTMYQQVRDTKSTFFQLQPSGRAPRDYLFAERLEQVRVLFREAFSDAKVNQIGPASVKTANALGLLGNLAASVALRVMVGN